MMAVVRHLGFFMCVRTTHEGHLVVFITVQDLVGIDAVRSWAFYVQRVILNLTLQKWNDMHCQKV